MLKRVLLTVAAVLACSDVSFAAQDCTRSYTLVQIPSGSQALDTPCLPGAIGAQAIAGCLNCPGLTVQASDGTPLCRRMVPRRIVALVEVPAQGAPCSGFFVPSFERVHQPAMTAPAPILRSLPPVRRIAPAPILRIAAPRPATPQAIHQLR